LKKSFIPIRYLLVVACFFLTVLLYVDRAAISVAKDDITRDLGLTGEQFGWAMAVFTLGYALFQTPSGMWVDKKGPRIVISSIVALWSILTAITGAAFNFVSLLIIRFLFGAGEAGAFPSLSKVIYKWFPLNERGTVQGINFSGSRLGAAFGIPVVTVIIQTFGWREAFVFFGVVGVVFAVVWFFTFRDTPEESTLISEEEKTYIVESRQQVVKNESEHIPFLTIIRARVMQLAMVQYICSNFTFYFTLTWMFPFIKQKFAMSAVEASLYTSIPLIAGFMGNVISGIAVDALYRNGYGKYSRRVPAMIGFALASFGMIMVTMSDSPFMAVLFLSIAVFGADMTLSPSWAFCIDVGKKHAGAFSSTMNMAGNLGAFVTIIAFPYLLKWTGSQLPFFYIAAGLSAVAIVVWMFMSPEESLLPDH
jgi:MFS transporter, ACS family, glucarate transporter